MKKTIILILSLLLSSLLLLTCSRTWDNPIDPLNDKVLKVQVGADAYMAANQTMREGMTPKLRVTLRITTNALSPVETKSTNRILMRFPVEAVSELKAATISSATLVMSLMGYMGNPPMGNPFTFHFCEVTKDWKEDMVTWKSNNNLAAWMPAGGEFQLPPAKQYVFTTVNVMGNLKIRIPFSQALVAKWVTTPNANKGILMKNGSEEVQMAPENSSVLEFISKDDGMASGDLKPHLIIHYKD